MVRSEPTADASFAAILERIKFGIAIAAMIKMIATTISNSIRENPFCFFIIRSPRSLTWNQYTSRCRKALAIYILFGPSREKSVYYLSVIEDLRPVNNQN